MLFLFQVCISVQRYRFLLKPFTARNWRRRYDLLISMAVWVFVAVGCLPFILMRSSGSGNASESLAPHTSAPAMPLSTTCSPNASAASSNGSCFKDLPMRKISVPLAVSLISMCELFGFLIPLACISYSSIRIAWSLNHSQPQNRQDSVAPGSSMRSRLQSFTSNGHPDKSHEKPANSGEKRRALQMVLSCSALFLLCFAPYHINFVLYMMVSQRVVVHCATVLAVKQFHPISLCLASMSCCLNPLLYYFLNAEFRMHLKRTSSFSNSILSSPSSPRDCPTQAKLLRMESTCSN